MWSWIRHWYAPDSRKAVWKDQLEATGWWNACHITRLIPPVTTYYLVQCCRKISLPLISITRLLSSAIKLARLTTHAWGLLYFTNYHIHGYRGFGLYNKTLDESKHHTRRVFIGQRVAYIDGKHQQNTPDKGLSEKTENSKNRTRAWRISIQRQAYSKEYSNTVHLVITENSIQLPTTTNLGYKAGYLRRR
jgi:hypothetical protein